jgi:hypothetical protein
MQTSRGCYSTSSSLRLGRVPPSSSALLPSQHLASSLRSPERPLRSTAVPAVFSTNTRPSQLRSTSCAYLSTLTRESASCGDSRRRLCRGSNSYEDPLRVVFPFSTLPSFSLAPARSRASSSSIACSFRYHGHGEGIEVGHQPCQG